MVERRGRMAKVMICGTLRWEVSGMIRGCINSFRISSVGAESRYVFRIRIVDVRKRC